MKTRQEKITLSTIFTEGYFPFVWIALAILLLYARSLSFGFTNFDDHTFIDRNSEFISDFRNIGQAFRQDMFRPSDISAYYRPVVILSFMSDAHIAGKTLFVYHATNIILHIIASILLYLFLETLGLSKINVFWLSLLFALHPALVRAVAWIPGRTEILLSIFSLLALLTARTTVTKKSVWLGVLSAISFFLALLSKETAIVLPVAALFYVYSLRLTMPRRFLAFLASLWFIAIGTWYFLRTAALVYSPDLGVLGMAKAVFQNSPHILWYVGKAFVPTSLSVLTIYRDASLISGFIASLFFAAVLYIMRKQLNVRYVVFGLVFFVVFLLPTLVSSLPRDSVDLKEDRLYSALIGILIIVGVCASAVETKYIRRDFLQLVAVVACAFFVLQGSLYMNIFRDDLVFWTHAVKRSPTSSVAYLNLGYAYHKRGDIEKAADMYKKTIEYNPKEQVARYNLGMIALGAQAYTEAAKYFLQEIQINPYYSDAYLNLGITYYEIGRIDDAIVVWRKGLEARPDDTRLQANIDTVQKIKP